ncbi:MAG: hypothetical protein H6832_15005 [Planctomycetes bacterium]|nr:hypothetical protein [Planctomycetota bacterium]
MGYEAWFANSSLDECCKKAVREERRRVALILEGMAQVEETCIADATPHGKCLHMANLAVLREALRATLDGNTLLEEFCLETEIEESARKVIDEKLPGPGRVLDVPGEIVNLNEPAPGTSS